MECVIKLNKLDKKYYAGETLTGSVEISNPEPKKVRSIDLAILGSSEVRWTEAQNRGNGASRLATYTSVEQYINSRTVLFGTLDGKVQDFPAGFHTYNFSCVLPDRLPYTLYSCWGQIVYKIKCTVNIPWSFNFKETTNFTVLNVRDLNLTPHLRLAVEQETINEFCVWKCGPNKVIITVRLPKGGFVPDEIITINLTIDNITTVPFISVIFSLIQVITFKSNMPTRKSKNFIKNLRNWKTSTLSKDITQIVGKITVPETPVTCCLSTNILVKYFVVVECVVNKMHKNVKINIPVDIGTIPVRDQSTPNFNLRVNLEEPPSYEEATKSQN